jgi:uridine kinase
LLQGMAKGLTGNREPLRASPCFKNNYAVFFSQKKMSVVMIGICGRTGSGKSTMAKRIRNYFGTDRAAILSMDDFYRELTPEDHELALRNEYDFDCLESFDLQRLVETVRSAKEGKEFPLVQYDHATHKHRLVEVCEGGKAAPMVWIVEGLYLFAVQELNPLFDLKLFMDIDSDESLLRRIRRDIVYRRRNVEGVLMQYEKYVKPAYEKIVLPYRGDADICVLHGAFNDPAFSAICNFIKAHQRFSKAE